MLFLLEHREIVYGVIALVAVLFVWLVYQNVSNHRNRAHYTKLRLGVNPINAKPHPINFIPKDKLMSKERFVTRYEGIPSSIYEPDPKKRKRY